MVRIDSSGELIDDPSPPSSAERNVYRRQRPEQRSFAQSNTGNAEAGAGAGAGDAFTGLWATANERLSQLGLTSFEVGAYVIEPAHIVLAVLAFIMFGPMAVVLVIIGLIVSQSGAVGGTATSQAAPRTSANSASGSANPFHNDPSYYRGAQGDSNTKKPAPSKPSGAFAGSGQRLGGN